jgi:hypothetical protein
MANVAISEPLSNLQLELLKLYGSGVSEEDLQAINQLIINFFAKKAQDEADKVWQTKKYSNDLMDGWLNTDLRK